MQRERIIQEMRKVFREIPYGIDHTLKVLQHAEAIMEGENVAMEERESIAIIAVLHDIGAVEALHKYGSIDGIYQEKEGPAVARGILEKVGYDPTRIDRICYVIGNHHTPSKIDGLDFQIQWEADLIENLLGSGDRTDRSKLADVIDKNFKTATGKSLVCRLFDLA